MLRGGTRPYFSPPPRIGPIAWPNDAGQSLNPLILIANSAQTFGNVYKTEQRAQ
jgi:hypothetical protein